MRKLRKLLYKWVDKKFLGGCSSYNSLTVRKSCRSKKQAREVFSTLTIPHANGDVFYGFVKPIVFARKYGFPLCVKPNVSGFSRGSHFPITSYRDLIQAIIMVKIWWPSSIIEQYLEGNNYRVVVIKDSIMSVIKRYPPFVTGDGVSTISELIDKENMLRQSMGLYPVIHPISKNTIAERYLKKQSLSMDSVPEINRKIVLHNRIALAPGGVVETIDKNKVHPENVELFLKLIRHFGANILGVDAIFEKGIEIPHDEQKTIFLEINSRPYLKMHDYPRYGKKEDLSIFFESLNRLEVEEQDIF